MAFRIRKRLLKNTVSCYSKKILHMRKQWIPGPFLSPREKGLGTRLIESVLASLAQIISIELPEYTGKDHA